MLIPKISKNQYTNTFNKDVYKNLRKKFQDPTSDLLDPKVEFIGWCPYFELDTLIVPNKTASLEFQYTL